MRLGCRGCVVMCVLVCGLVTACDPASAAQPPAITDEIDSGVTATEARVSTRIDAGGESARYWVEYGTTAAYGSRTPEANLGAQEGAVSVAAQLTGLVAGTEYHFRFVSSNSLGTTPGPDATFTTIAFGASEIELPDNRGYELVSGVGSPGEVFLPDGPVTVFPRKEDQETNLPFRASADGRSVAYAGDPGEAGGNGFSGGGEGNALIAVRDPEQHRWDITDATPPPLTEHVEEPQYLAFSSDLSVGVLVEPVARGLASIGLDGPAGCQVLYSRTGGGYRALITETQTPGNCGEYEATEPSLTGQALAFAGGDAGTPTVPQYSQLIFQTPAPLSAGTERSPEGSGKNLEGDGNNLYDFVDGQMHLVSVLPDGDPSSNAVFGAPPGAAGSRANFSNVISADGTRVFWTDLTTDGLYAREDPASPTAKTVQLDDTEGPGPSGGGLFWTASADGARVLFTDCNRLTSDATAISAPGCEHESDEGNQVTGTSHRLLSGNDLYEYNFDAPPGERLTDLTVDANAGDPLRADVQGVVGASEDGSYVYFVAGGALAPGAEPRTCREPEEEEREKREQEEPISEQEQRRLQAERRQELLGHLPAGRGCNLYLKHAGEPATLIATLAAKDDHLERSYGSTKVRLGAWQRELGSRTAEATPSGRDLVFESTQQLTGYDNSLLAEEAPERGAEVFVYDAATERLTCASCDPRNSPPTSEAAETEHAGSGTYLPPSLSATSMRRWISEDGGRVFFDTSQPLVPQDTNGTQDVYEWEREGTPACPSASSDSGGCIFLISGGSSSDVSDFVDADTTGTNVFFTHRGGLGHVTTTEGKTNLYDARVGGGFPESTAGCAGSGCQSAPPVPPVFAAPATSTFDGLGNLPAPAPAKGKTAEQLRRERLAKALKACQAKKNRHRRAICRAQAFRRYAVAHQTEKSRRGKKPVKKRTGKR
jgi:hypothetical protein